MTRKMAALVMGNAAHRKKPLKNPVNDATDMAAKLKHYDFNVILGTDYTNKDMSKALKAFQKLLDSHEVGLFFFAGHGIQIDGHNYLLATDTDVSTQTEIEHGSLSLDKVLKVMERSKASTKIIILDACRDNPWERRWNRSAATRGLASVYAPKGTIIGFATSPGEVADDGAGRNGTYTEALLQHIDQADCTIETMFKQVRNTVAAATNSAQTSWEHTSLSGEFYFNMSLGKLIDEYDPTALSDSLFVLDITKKSHYITNGLKSHNWDQQNEALDKLDAPSAAKMLPSNLFVLGRNIYQAACGTARTASDFLNNFMPRTQGYDKGKRKALLDGMLFEIFFDSKGQLRGDIKGEYFNKVFELEQHAELKDSFEFIAKALTAARGDFHSLPGKGHQLQVTVNIKKVDNDHFVEAIYAAGINLLRLGDTDWLYTDQKGDPETGPITTAQLAKQLSQELVVPQRLLRVTYTPKGAVPDDKKLNIARAWTVRKA
jgi:uncharacterized caspase-like protein